MTPAASDPLPRSAPGGGRPACGSGRPASSSRGRRARPPRRQARRRAWPAPAARRRRDSACCLSSAPSFLSLPEGASAGGAGAMNPSPGTYRRTEATFTLCGVMSRRAGAVQTGRVDRGPRQPRGARHEQHHRTQTTRRITTTSPLTSVMAVIVTIAVAALVIWALNQPATVTVTTTGGAAAVSPVVHAATVAAPEAPAFRHALMRVERAGGYDRAPTSWAARTWSRGRPSTRSAPARTGPAPYDPPNYPR